MFSEFPELGEVDLTTLDAVGTTLVHEIHVFDEEREEGDHDLLKNGKYQILRLV